MKWGSTTWALHIYTTRTEQNECSSMMEKMKMIEKEITIDMVLLRITTKTETDKARTKTIMVMVVIRGVIQTWNRTGDRKTMYTRHLNPATKMMTSCGMMSEMRNKVRSSTRATKTMTIATIGENHMMIRSANLDLLKLNKVNKLKTKWKLLISILSDKILNQNNKKWL